MAEEVLQDKSPLDWDAMKNTNNIRESIAKVIPGLESLATIGKTKQEFQIPGRTFHTPKFPTPTGKANLHVHKLPALAGSAGELRMMSVRSEGQFNTVVYETEDLYRGQERRDIILMHPDDLAARGLTHNQLVTVRSGTGKMERILARGYADIRAGNALMYYPECNVLIPRTSDPQSKTPAFKCILVTLEATAPAVSQIRAKAT